MKGTYDFSGYATKNDVKCADGRTIRRDAFKDSNGKKVPLVWQHLHGDIENVLGHAILENREDGVYAYGIFNDSPDGQKAKMAVQHEDITALSIYANGLVEKSKEVLHGIIREVSLVMAGANPGALIDYITLTHSDGHETTADDEAIIWSGEDIVLPGKEKEIKHEDAAPESGDGGKSYKQIYDEMKPEQQGLLAYVLSQLEVEVPEDSDVAQSAIKHSTEEEGDDVVKHNVFSDTNAAETSATGTKPRQFTKEELRTAFGYAFEHKMSVKDSILMHAGTYGIDNIGYLFPDAVATDSTPQFIKRDTGWVAGVINGCKHSRFSRIKTVMADITPDAARALGYVTGALKKEEVFALQTRSTTPQTIYKKQKLDRDDVIDITDFDVIVWMKGEMRVMMDEEIARAVLIGDGRDPVTEAADKIVETNVRPIYKDSAAVYVHSVRLANTATIDDVEEAIIRGRSGYRGSGSPTMYAGMTFINDLLLQKDTTGRRLYRTLDELASALLVSRIVEVPVMEGVNRDSTQTIPINMALKAIIVNLSDYTIGADKGGELNWFDDFDIDYNQMKYLLETRISGALTKYKSAIVVEQDTEVDNNV